MSAPAAPPGIRGPRLRFDFVDAAGVQHARLFEEPESVIVARTLDDVLPAMRAVERGVADGCHAAGFVSYEAAPAFDCALTARPPSRLPLVWFGLFRAPRIVDTGPDPYDTSSVAAADDSRQREADWVPDVSPQQYREAIATVREAIARGDSYQANYTFRLQGHMSAAQAGAIYARQRRAHRPGYAAWLDIGDWQIVSLSPELFFRIDGRRIVTRPMKGTAPRGRWAEDDERQRAWLYASEKNRAENVMIVDLSRNDLGRVSTVGSVRATSLFDVERYPSLFQMVSTVEGELRPDVTLTDVFTAMFPAGSVTGAPKSSSMRLIMEIEQSPRGIYCGAIGFVSPQGEAVFNVAIRTAVIDAHTGRAEYGVGGGITWDSETSAEYDEAIAKAAVLQPVSAFDLIETMRFDGSGYVRRDRHLRRLRASADYFDVDYDDDAVERVLDEHASAHSGAVRRVRLLLDADGRATVDSQPFGGNPAPVKRVALARAAVSSRDRWLFHKTTRRTMYDERRRHWPDAFDVLLWNERDEITEFTIGNVVVEIDGVCWTPSRSSGLLAGVFREELLDAGIVRERVLHRADLRRATRIWLVNSLREWVSVILE